MFTDREENRCSLHSEGMEFRVAVIQSFDNVVGGGHDVLDKDIHFTGKIARPVRKII